MFINLKTVKNILFFVMIFGFGLGFYLGMNDFLLNLSAEFVGLSLGFLVAFLVINKSVDAFNDALKEKQWSKVRNSTYRSIIDDLCIIAFNIYIKLPIESLSYFDSYDPSEIKNHNEKILAELPKEFKTFLDLIAKMVGHDEITIEEGSGKGLSVSQSDVTKFLETTFEDIQPVLDGIRYFKIPRIQQSSTDQEIIDDLIVFDGIIDAYYYNVRRFNREGTHRAPLTIKSMEKLIDKTLQLYSKMKAKTDKAVDR
jgi:hypothetical protein